FEPRRCAPCSAARRHPLPIEEKFDGRVDEEVAHPHPSQTRMCRFPASGPSWESLARGGADDTIRDLPPTKDSTYYLRPRSHCCQFSYLQRPVMGNNRLFELRCPVRERR